MILLTILAGFVVACALVPFGKYFRDGRSIYLSILPLLLFSFFITQVPSISNGVTILEAHSWVPSLNVNADFNLDGLSLLFALLITGIGSLIFIYASAYLKNHPFIDRFFGYLCLFMAAMLGMVLSDNILLLFVFWELTTISSFFLIGFNNDSEDSRKSAITALSITGIGGFFLLVGLILISQIGNSYSITELIESSNIITEHYLYPVILFFIFIGAFTKSAQFPFHFWLPNAMKAPTPVSAYLHSATMVKAGVFLLARMSPVLGDTLEWSYTLMIVGGFTMIYAAIHSLFRTDLKAILAYSTIAALGILVFLIGLGTKEAFIAMATFIIVHALYKASLFMITGIIDHETGTRNLTKLRGLKKVLFPVYIAGVLAALSSAGLPFTIGFIGKDLIYESTLTAATSFALYITIAAVLTNTCLVAAGFMAGIRPFTGKILPELETVKLPSKVFWIPPIILSVLGILFGFFPAFVGDFLVSPLVDAIANDKVVVSLKVWHGFNTVLTLSLSTLALGTIVYFINKPSENKLLWLARLSALSPEILYKKFCQKMIVLSTYFTNLMHNGYLRSYVIKIIIFTEVLLIYQLYVGGPLIIDYTILSEITLFDAAAVVFLLGGVVMTLFTKSRLTAVIGTSIVGYALCLLFMIYSAPDLAITQFTIDTLVVVLFVLVMFNLPPFIKMADINSKVILRDAVVSISFGFIMSLIALRVLQVPTSKEVSEFYGTFAYTLAKGKNVVNVILVDFRGMDTMFEIIVLSISAIGVYSLIKLRLKASEKE